MLALTDRSHTCHASESISSYSHQCFRKLCYVAWDLLLPTYAEYPSRIIKTYHVNRRLIEHEDTGHAIQSSLVNATGAQNHVKRVAPLWSCENNSAGSPSRTSFLSTPKKPPLEYPFLSRLSLPNCIGLSVIILFITNILREFYSSLISKGAKTLHKFSLNGKAKNI